jgi:hypothetical protein
MGMTKENEAEALPINYKDIHHAINGVYNNVGYVAKKGKVDIGGNRSYKFAGEAEFIAAIRPEMAEAGIYQHPLNVQIITNERIESVKVWDNKETKSYQHRVVIKSTYRFTHINSGTFVDVESIGEGMDSGDKSFNKAMTGANKYALRQLFMIETGDDPDKYASDENGGVVAVESKPKPAFSNASLRNTFTKNVISSFNEIDEGAEDAMGTLTTLYQLNSEKLGLMKASGDEHDGLALDEIRKVYAMKKQTIEQLASMNEQLGGVK